MKLDRFHIEDVRCFRGPQEVRIRPLTFLVGENSTGKTTVLGCLQALADYLHYPHGPIDFNRGPYQMGSFREIARKSRPLVPSFRLGVTFDHVVDGQTTYLATLRELRGGARAEISNAIWTFGDASIAFHRRENALFAQRDRSRIAVNDDGKSISVEVPEPVFGRLQSRPWMLPSWIDVEPRVQQFIESLHSFFVKADGRVRRMPLISWPSISIAPVRSRPERTYNPFHDTPDAEGTDVPVTIANIARKDDRRWHELKEQLQMLGKQTGLFSEIAIKKLGTSGIDPFQLQVKARGPKVNLIDVGYGVSQMLPILMRLVQSRRSSVSLIQQPEVHLHPRAQAALSSILINMLGDDASRRDRQRVFVIETHSDYMLDRTRIEIRRGRISPDDVSLVYFEPLARRGVSIHNVTFDEMGNMEGTPNTYREFFLRETNAFLGLDE